MRILICYSYVWHEPTLNLPHLTALLGHAFHMKIKRIFVQDLVAWPDGSSLAELLAQARAQDRDAWLDAELYTVYDYARCSKMLQLADDLKSALPVR